MVSDKLHVNFEIELFPLNPRIPSKFRIAIIEYTVYRCSILRYSHVFGLDKYTLYSIIV